MLGAFLRRDFLIAVSYPVPFLFDALGAVFVVVEFYFLSRLVPDAPATGDYLAFGITGLVVTTFLVSSASVIAASVRQEQIQGTLEMVLSTGVPLSELSLGIAAYPVVAGGVRASLYALMAMALGTSLPGANWSLAIAAIAAGAVSFVGVGLIAVALVLVARQAAGAVGWLLGAATLLAGVFFPVALLPGWLRFLSGLSAATWVLRTTRAALLEGASWTSEWRSMVVIVVMGVGYLAVALVVLALSLRRAKRNGGLAQY